MDDRGNRRPLVSIGTPIFNEERYLSQTLDSLLAQDFRDFELVVSDNASEDDTRKICLEYAARDSRIRYSRRSVNVGPVENFNCVFRMSSGKYFVWASGHDLWAPQFLSHCVEVLEREPDVVLCYPRSVVIDADGKELRPSDPPTATRNQGLFLRFNLVVWAVGCSWAFHGVIRSEALKKTRLTQAVIEADTVLLSELALLGPFANVPEVLFFQRYKWGDESRRDERLARLFKMLYPREQNRRPRFPYLGWIREELLAVERTELGPVQKVALIGSVFLGYFSRYRIYLPRSLRLGARSFLNRRVGV